MRSLEHGEPESHLFGDLKDGHEPDIGVNDFDDIHEPDMPDDVCDMDVDMDIPTYPDKVLLLFVVVFNHPIFGCHNVFSLPILRIMMQHWMELKVHRIAWMRMKALKICVGHIW